MGVFSAILGLPFAPVRGVVALAELIEQRVDQEYRGAASVRRQLEAVEEARSAGEISAEDADRLQEQLLERVIEPRSGAAPPRR